MQSDMHCCCLESMVSGEEKKKAQGGIDFGEDGVLLFGYAPDRTKVQAYKGSTRPVIRMLVL